MFPNSIGSVQWSRAGGGLDSTGPYIYSAGSMTIEKMGSSQTAEASNLLGPGDIRISLDLSKGDSIFGISETNQPASLRSLALIRAY